MSISLNRALATVMQHPQAHMAELCSRAWFERVWTMQELVLSRHCLVICGRETIAWATFAAGADMFWSWWEYTSRKLPPCQGLLHRFWRWEVLQDIPTLTNQRERLVAYFLLSSRSQKSTNSKDKLYAIFSIVKRLGF